MVDWSIVKPNAIESSGDTLLIPANKKAEIVITNVFAGCSANCVVNTAVQTSGGIGNKISVLVFFIDKRNVVELTHVCVD